MDRIATLNKRLDELQAIPAGWLDGEGAAITPELIAEARRILTLLLSNREHLARPSLYPTPEGSIEAAWDYSDRMFTVYFTPEGLHVYETFTVGRENEYTIALDGTLAPVIQLGLIVDVPVSSDV